MRTLLDGVRGERLAIAVLVVLCLASRLVTTIYYLEDPDSLHFALSMIEFDVARLQPHFPGYVVFVGLARGLAAMTGSFAIAFSLVGALATVLLVLGLLALVRWPLASRRGALVALAVVGNGMLWLYANRYMPDLLGAALLVWSLHDLSSDDPRSRVRGGLLTALLAGTRLSYLPFLLPAVMHAVVARTGRLPLAASFVAGVMLWAVPLVVLTGWEEIVAIAANQTTGHFDEFGGTIRTEPDVGLRLARMAEGVWTDGLGGWVPGRSPLTMLTAVAATIGLALAAPRARRALGSRRGRLVLLGALAYLLWIFLYQNVIHHTRHLLPLVPLLALAIAVGWERVASRGRAGSAIAAASIAAVAVLGGVLAWNHRQPTAIAQVSRALINEREGLTIVSTGLVNDMLAGTGVRARFLAVGRDSVADSLRLTPPSGRLFSVGDYRSNVRMPVARLTRFHHNPHVNRIWPLIELYEYRAAEARR